MQNQNDIVKRLRHMADLYHSSSMESIVCLDAASEIERLRDLATHSIEEAPPVTSVQACFSHVGKALESEPQEDDDHV